MVVGSFVLATETPSAAAMPTIEPLKNKALQKSVRTLNARRSSDLELDSEIERRDLDGAHARRFDSL
jgi:hypothetical protein